MSWLRSLPVAIEMLGVSEMSNDLGQVFSCTRRTISYHSTTKLTCETQKPDLR